MRLLVTIYLKKDMHRYTEKTPHAEALQDVEGYTSAVNCRATDYAARWVVPPHSHAKHQLIYAIAGVMTVKTEAGHWVVPPSRGLWVPAGMIHAIRCLSEVHMRSLYVRPDADAQMLGDCCVVGISPLLRELIGAAADIACPYAEDSRDGRLMRLLLDELCALPVLPLYLPMPSDVRVLRICESLQQRLDDPSTLADWALHLGLNAKTIQRLFMAQTGMSFGRWRQQARLLRALELLAEGEKVIDIALTLGYESPSAFTSMFRKQFGQTPSQFFAHG